MVKVFVVYDTMHGNTKLVAEKIVEGMKEIEGIETAISDVKEVDLKRVAGYDAILIGGPLILAHLLGLLMGLLIILANLTWRLNGLLFSTLILKQTSRWL